MQGNKTIIFIGLGLLLVIAALEMVITSRNPAKGLIHHSDRGPLRQRKHSSIGYMSPMEYEKQWQQTTATAA